MTNDRIYTFSDALIALYPEGGWSVSYTYDSIIWTHKTKPKPTESVLTAKVKELQDTYASTEYQRKREASYDSLANQLDMLYHDIVAGKLDTTGTWATHIKAVKDGNPKP